MNPVTKLDPRFSSPDAQAVPWSEADAALNRAEIFWVTTVRADGRPHVVPLLAVWHQGAVYFSTGAEEQKYKNIEANRHVVLTTGNNAYRQGLDVVVEGEAVQTKDEALAATRSPRSGRRSSTGRSRSETASSTIREGGDAPMFEVRPTKVLAFGRGEKFTQTRYRFTDTGVAR